MSDAPAPWDPLSAVPSSYFTGDSSQKWAEKHWLNVPGPFYTGQTDNCWTGRLSAPRNILYGGEYYNEFVYRQPKTPAEVKDVLEAAEADPFVGYACDGDDRWTPEAVRAWWRSRSLVEEHLAVLLTEFSAPDAKPDEREAAEGVRDFIAYLADGLGDDLRVYLARLERGHYPGNGDRLPEL